MISERRVGWLSGGVLAVTYLIGCGGPSGPQRPEIITIDGSSTVFPITEAVAEEFQRVTPDARITVGISGTGGGFQKFCRGEIDIAGASRPIKASELAACTAGGVAFIELPIAYDGIAVVVHPSNDWVTSMTVAELETLWAPPAQGTVLRWSQVREGWPDREVHLFGPGVDSGTFDYFTQVIVGDEGASRGDFTSSEDDNVLVQGIASDGLALGYFGFAYYQENTGRLRALGIAIDPQTPPVFPSTDTILTGAYRPLARPVFIYVRIEAAERPLVAAFVEYYLQEGATLSRDVGYVPLRDRAYALARDRFRDRTAGTMYEAATPGASLESLLSGGRE